MKKNIKRKLFEVICACTVITALSVSTVGAASINSNKPVSYTHLKKLYRHKWIYKRGTNENYQFISKTEKVH